MYVKYLKSSIYFNVKKFNLLKQIYIEVDPNLKMN